MPPIPRLTTLLLPSLLLLSVATASAGEFISNSGIPDDVLKRNIARLVDFVISKRLDSRPPSATVTRIIGKEDLGFSKARVWFCVRRQQNGQPIDACGNEVKLIRLDTGRWILQDEKRDNWIVVQE